jgi:hypothetical protein
MKIKSGTTVHSSLTFLFVLFLYSVNVSAQEVGINWSKEVDIEKKSASPELLGLSDGKIFVLRSANPKDAASYYVTVCDEGSLDEDDRIDFEKVLPKEVGHYDMFGTYLFKDRIVVITTSKNKELCATTISLKGKIIKAKTVIDKVEGKDKTFDGYEIAISPDKTKILGYRSQKGKIKKTVAYNFTVIDENLKQVKEKKIELPYEEENFEFRKVSLDDKGDVFAVAKIKIEGKRKKYDTHKAVLMSLPLSQDKPELNEVVLPFEKRIASSMSFIMQPGKILITGMYASNKDADFLDGIFYIELNPQNFEVIKSSYEKFKPGLQTRKDGTSAKMDSKVGYEYVLKDIYINSNDEKFLTFEYNTHMFVTSRTSTSKVVYRHDIIVAKLSSDNKILWNTIINKNQVLSVPYTVTTGIGPIAITTSVYRFYRKFETMLTYVILYKNDDIYFVFNDHTKNMKTKNADKPFNSLKKSYSALVKLDGSKGKWDKKPIFTTKESGRIITPGNSVQISDSKILTFSYYKNKGSIGYLSIE